MVSSIATLSCLLACATPPSTASPAGFREQVQPVVSRADSDAGATHGTDGHASFAAHQAQSPLARRHGARAGGFPLAVSGMGLVQVAVNGAILIALEEPIGGGATSKHVFHLTPRRPEESAAIPDYRGSLNVSYDRGRELLQVSSPTEHWMFGFTVRGVSDEETAALIRGRASMLGLISDGIELFHTPSVDSLLDMLGIPHDPNTAENVGDTEPPSWMTRLADEAPAVLGPIEATADRAPSPVPAYRCDVCQSGGDPSSVVQHHLWQ